MYTHKYNTCRSVHDEFEVFQIHTWVIQMSRCARCVYREKKREKERERKTD